MNYEYSDEEFKDPSVKLGTGDMFAQDKPAPMSVDEEWKLIRAKNKKKPVRKKKPVKMDHSLQTSMFESKFRSFLESIQTEDNKNLVENIAKAFDIIYPKT